MNGYASPSCDTCPHPVHIGWCPERIPAPDGSTDPCSCRARVASNKSAGNDNA